MAAIAGASSLQEALNVAQQELAGPRRAFRLHALSLGLDPAADFIGAPLRGIDLRNEDLAGFDFGDADLTGADLRNTGIRPEQLVGAITAGARFDSGATPRTSRARSAARRAKRTTISRFAGGGELAKFEIPDIAQITPKRHGDARGWFTEVWSARAYADAGIDVTFVQDNQAFSAARGTLRGLHFQHEPYAQAKLVRVLRGAVFDVAVDIRQGSPTFGRWIGVELTANGGEQLFIPRGFAHGYCTLTDDTEIFYQVDNAYAPQAEGSIRWDDPDLAIQWPFEQRELSMSAKDKVGPALRDLLSPP